MHFSASFGLKKGTKNWQLSNRVFNVLKRWLSHHFYDFEEEPNLISALSDFISQCMTKSSDNSMQKAGEQLATLLKQRVLSNLTLPVLWSIFFWGITTSFSQSWMALRERKRSSSASPHHHQFCLHLCHPCIQLSRQVHIDFLQLGHCSIEHSYSLKN